MHRNSEWAGCVANAAAAFATTKLGAQVSLPCSEGVQAMARQNRRIEFKTVAFQEGRRE
jgi:sugar/nucleoside kinase (ribokinase family)